MHLRRARKREERQTRLQQALEAFAGAEAGLLPRLDPEYDTSEGRCPSGWLAAAQRVLPGASADQAVDWTQVPPALDPSSGRLDDGRALRKRWQLSGALRHIFARLSSNDTVVDFGAGSGHLGLLLAYLRPDVTVYLVEAKEPGAVAAEARRVALGLSNCHVHHGDVRAFVQGFDLAVSMHSCGLLTDIIVRKAIAERARFVLVPCCYGQLRQDREEACCSVLFRKLDVHGDSMRVVVSAADYCVRAEGWNFETDVNFAVAKRCMRVVDADRLAYATEQGYRCQLQQLLPLICSPKNNVIAGEPASDHALHEEREYPAPLIGSNGPTSSMTACAEGVMGISLHV